MSQMPASGIFSATLASLSTEHHWCSVFTFKDSSDDPDVGERRLLRHACMAIDKGLLDLRLHIRFAGPIAVAGTWGKVILILVLFLLVALSWVLDEKPIHPRSM